MNVKWKLVSSGFKWACFLESNVNGSRWIKATPCVQEANSFGNPSHVVGTVRSCLGPCETGPKARQPVWHVGGPNSPANAEDSSHGAVS